IAQSEGRILWMLLPLLSPGRTMLLFTPGTIPSGTPVGAIEALIDAVIRHFASAGVLLAQMLIDPCDQAVVEQYATLGFARLADLVYLQRSAPWRAPAPQIPHGICIENYSSQTHVLFAAAIKSSYQSS